MSPDMILTDSFTIQNLTNDSYGDWSSAYSSRGPPAADTAVVGGIFFTVFTIMSVMLIMLLCKVWSLRRAVAPVTLHEICADGDSENGNIKQNHLTQRYV